MNNIQKIILVIGLIIAAIVFFSNDVGQIVPYIRVKHDDRIVEVMLKSEDELTDLIRKSQQNCLFFDGEYFFDAPPTKAIRENCRTYIIDGDRKIINGDMGAGDFYFIITMILLFTSVFVLFAAEPFTVDDYGDGY